MGRLEPLTVCGADQCNVVQRDAAQCNVVQQYVERSQYSHTRIVRKKLWKGLITPRKVS
jgi:hypothetical protein